MIYRYTPECCCEMDNEMDKQWTDFATVLTRYEEYDAYIVLTLN